MTGTKTILKSNNQPFLGNNISGDYVLEEEVKLLILCLNEYIKNIDGEEFKKLFLDYTEYMARNYGQDCMIDEYEQTRIAMEQLMKKYQLKKQDISSYKIDVIYRWINLGYDEQDILKLYYFKGSAKKLERFIDEIENNSQ